MIFNTDFQDIGFISYKKAWTYQDKIHEQVLLSRNSDSHFFLIFCEHSHVFTLGKNGKSNNLLINNEFLNTINAEYVETNRGGDITYHGPGQIVGYPIVDLTKTNYGIKEYINKLEEAIIQTLNAFNVKAERLEGATGVWLDTNTPKARKICAIGVRVSRWITMHGFAFNINTDLQYFNYINPCGFTDKSVTSLEKELNNKVDINSVKIELKYQLAKQLNLNYLT